MAVNDEIKTIFEQLGTGLELLGKGSFRSNAHKRVARQLADMPEEIGAFIDRDPNTATQRLEALPDIGKGAVRRILEWHETGRVEEHQKLLEQVPVGLFEILAVPGLGPKAVQLLWRELGIESLADLRHALEDPSNLEKLPRMGKKTVENLQKALTFSQETRGRVPIGRARPVALELVEHLSRVEGVDRCCYAGSLRRGRETIGDIDILVSLENDTVDPDTIAEAFVSFPRATQVLARGHGKSSVRLSYEDVALQADLRIVPRKSWGAALLYFTGSKEHNVKLRQIAIKQDLRLNEFGLYPYEAVKRKKSAAGDDADESSADAEKTVAPQDLGIEPVASETEQAIYQALGLDFVPPELREDRGELDGPPPLLIEESQLIAELHAHTTASDGKLTLEDLADEARRRGLSVLGITDHSQSSVLAGGLKPDQLRRHVERVRELDQKLSDLRLLAGAEVDIFPDGGLDYDDELLAELDLVIASPHMSLRQDSKSATERLLRAVRHPAVHVLGHPTGRKIGRREGLQPDMSAIVAAAAECGTALEINANWRRLDLRDSHVKQALTAGCLIAVNTDAHMVEDLDYRIYGVLTGRRGGLTAERCVNCWEEERLLAWLADKQSARSAAQ